MCLHEGAPRPGARRNCGRGLPRRMSAGRHRWAEERHPPTKMRKLAPLSLLLVLTGCAGATDLGPAPKAKSQAAAKLTSPTPAQKLVPLKIWLVQGKGLVQRNRAHPKTVRVATAALQELLAGPTEAERSGSAITTAIPGGTRLLGIGIDNEVATVDLA